jgi:hypothetical protein
MIAARARGSRCSRSRAARQRFCTPALRAGATRALLYQRDDRLSAIVDGVAVLPLDALVAWLKTTNAQASYPAQLERS